MNPPTQDIDPQQAKLELLIEGLAQTIVKELRKENQRSTWDWVDALGLSLFCFTALITSSFVAIIYCGNQTETRINCVSGLMTVIMICLSVIGPVFVLFRRKWLDKRIIEYV